MMKTHLWNDTKTFPDKVNFVDSNNVILGYDLGQSCCEHAFWTISDNPKGENPIYDGDELDGQEIELENYFFDPYFHEEEACAAIFKLVSFPYLNKPDLYIRLENNHNGYYSHGFCFRGGVIVEGSI